MSYEYPADWKIKLPKHLLLEQEEEEDFFRILELLDKAKSGELEFAIDQRSQTITIFDKKTKEVFFSTSIADYNKILEERKELKGDDS